MLPRKSPRLSAPDPPHSSLPTSASFPLRAGTAMYQMPELRSRIWSCLDRNTLSTVMRVEKKGMAAVACRLYHTVDYNHVRLRMSVSTERRRMYCDSVSVVDARGMTLTPTMIRQLHLDAESIDLGGLSRQEYISNWLESYHPEVLEVVLPGLRKKCGSLRKVIFGHRDDPRGHDSWVVELDRSGNPLSESGTEVAAAARGIGGGTGIGSGHIQHRRSIRLNLDVALPTLPDTISSTLTTPSPHFTIQSRFNLILYRTGQLSSSLADAWLVALQRDAGFSNLSQTIDFGSLPVTLDIISSLYQRQTNAGHSDRLSFISAPRVAPVSVNDLRSFANIASTSLTTLILAKRPPPGGGSGNGKIWVKHIPQIIKIARKLPHLDELHFAMKGMRYGEAACRGMLTRDALRPSGSITKLRVYTSQTSATPPPFNTLRCLAALVTQDANVQVCGEGPEQKVFLNYLKNRPAKQRTRLAVVDFTYLGLSALEDVLDLRYDKHHHPRSLLNSLSTEWTEATRPLRAAKPVFVAPGSADTPNPLSLEQMKDQLAAVDKAERAASRIEAVIAATRQKGAELREAIRVVESSAKEADEAAALAAEATVGA